MSKLLPISIAALMAAAAVAPAALQAENTLTSVSGVYPAAISPSGNMMVGTNFGWDSNWVNMTHKSFKWSDADGLEWIIDYDGKDGCESGWFHCVNDKGMIAGAVKDEDIRLAGGGNIFAPPAGSRPETREEKGRPIFHAAVWRDGKTYVLPGGLNPADSYSEEEDGTHAVGISADGMFVVGHNMLAYYPDGIMGWQYDEENDEYIYVPFQVPENAFAADLFGLSPDAMKVYGEIRERGEGGVITYPAIWTDPNTCMVIELPDADQYAMGSGLCAWSADGNKVLVYGTGYTRHFLGVYDIEENELTEIKVPSGVMEVRGYAVTDNGNVFATLKDPNWNIAPYYYDANTATFMPLGTYFRECAQGIEYNSLFSATVVGVSGDGKRIVFNNGDSKERPGTVMILDLDNPAVLSLTAPELTAFYHNSPTEVTARWNGLDIIPEGLELRGYQLFIDGDLAETKEYTEAGGDFSVTLPAAVGRMHTAALKTLYVKEGKDQESLLSKRSSVQIAADTSLLGFDNFDNCSIDGNGNPIYTGTDWTNETVVANPLVIQWSLSVRDWDNNNPYAQLSAISEGQPWGYAFTSRWHDATDAEDFFLSFYVNSKEANELGQVRAKDFLDVEYTTDGYEWKLLKSICAADMAHATWNFHRVDLGDELAGKVFRIRFHAHGEGMAQLIWGLDCIGINDEMLADAPTGMRVINDNDKGIELTWHNTKGAWDVSHVINSYVEADANAADENGEPIMLGVKLGQDKVAAHVGEYISGVSAFLYDLPDLMTQSVVEAVVFEDGEEVARTSFKGPFDVVGPTTAWLEKPVLISKGKTYILGVNLKTYNPEYPPLYYQKVDEKDCIPNVTDLFSEDGGETWVSLHDEYAYIYSEDDQQALREYGNCIWSIHADITSEEGKVNPTQQDPEIIGYTVYRNGEQINPMVVYAPHMKFVDTDPLQQATYAVQAFYRDGRVSPLSAPFDYIRFSSVESVTEEAPVFTVSEEAITFAGTYDVAELYALGGVKVAMARKGQAISTKNLPAGVYLLRVETGNRVDAVKIMVK